MTLSELLQKHHLTQAQAAIEAGLPGSRVSQIVRGAAEPRRPTINRILAFARRYEPTITYEDLFAPDVPRPTSELVAPVGAASAA